MSKFGLKRIKTPTHTQTLINIGTLKNSFASDTYPIEFCLYSSSSENVKSKKQDFLIRFLNSCLKTDWGSQVLKNTEFPLTNKQETPDLFTFLIVNP